MNTKESTMSAATTPEIEKAQWAQTLTPTAQHVIVFVTAVDGETESGWFVYGYRVYARRRNGRRHSMIPNRYFVPKAVQP